MLLLPFLMGEQAALSQERITDEVAVTVVRREVFAATPGEGLLRVQLSAGERVEAVKASGINALVLTSVRLLGFSGSARRWTDQRLDIYEEILDWSVTPRLILVRTDKRLYGYQGSTGRWAVEDIGPREEQLKVLLGDHVAVVVTQRRALAFSAFTGGFFPQDLPPDEKIKESQVNDNIVILSTDVRRLIFRSRLRIWAELR